MRKPLVAVIAALAVLLGVALTAAPATAAKPPTTFDGLTTAVTGTFDDALGGTGTFTGTTTVTQFVSDSGQLLARTTTTGTLTDSAGNVLGTDTATATAPVDRQATTGSCEILNLVLGPLDLDLLGLVVTLNQVELNITAESGPGNLLGNLLCAVAGLLDSSAPSNILANLLNRILGLLG